VTSERAAIAKLLVERFRRRPRFLPVRQVVSVIRRLIKHSRFNERGCLIWRGNKNNDGYGRITVYLHGQQFKFYVHRLSWQLAHDPRDIPWYREISPRCDTPACFHPSCVELVRKPVNRRRSAENTNRKKALRKANADLRPNYADAGSAAA
jgi:hypothetical protein